MNFFYFWGGEPGGLSHLLVTYVLIEEKFSRIGRKLNRVLLTLTVWLLALRQRNSNWFGFVVESSQPGKEAWRRNFLWVHDHSLSFHLNPFHPIPTSNNTTTHIIKFVYFLLIFLYFGSISSENSPQPCFQCRSHDSSNCRDWPNQRRTLNCVAVIGLYDRLFQETLAEKFNQTALHV